MNTTRETPSIIPPGATGAIVYTPQGVELVPCTNTDKAHLYSRYHAPCALDARGDPVRMTHAQFYERKGEFNPATSATAIHLYVGVMEAVEKEKVSTEDLHDLGGMIGMTSRLAELALAADAGAWGLRQAHEIPGVWEYEIIEPMGAWLVTRKFYEGSVTALEVMEWVYQATLKWMSDNGATDVSTGKRVVVSKTCGQCRSGDHLRRRVWFAWNPERGAEELDKSDSGEWFCTHCDDDTVVRTGYGLI